MSNDAGIVTRWRARLAIRRRLLDYAQRQYSYWYRRWRDSVVWNLSDAERSRRWQLMRDRRAKRDMRLAQVAYAERVIARHRRTEPSVDIVRSSPNQSSRGGVKPRVIVLHSTEGSFDGAVSWLCNPASRASAHIVVSRGAEVARLVPDDRKAWHAATYNPQSLGIEQEGYAAQDSWPDAQLEEVARWIAHWSREHDIPITSSTTHGVCRHSDLGGSGGGHHDPGDAYPFGKVLELARSYR